MRAVWKVGLSLASVMLFAGCASAPVVTPAAPIARARNDSVRVARAVNALSPLLGGRNLRAALDDTPAVGAYAWPDGRILLTRGLVRLLDDDELAAAVAHEMGHLLEETHAPAVASLDGAGATADPEFRADAAGARLLARTGVPAAAMARMLEKVAASPGTTIACRARLLQRIARLRNP
jgi:Zn-dependent protease with chaperone function